ncbi:heat-shock protein HtpX [Candidatus Bathyarchaeota archaeon]|nr:MAG: heat-shock protein HtpX [Candidatus Bathyarchaeota archaeon]
MVISRPVISFSITTEVTPAHYSELLLFIYQNYLIPFAGVFSNVRRWITDRGEVLAFTFIDTEGRWHVDIEVETGNPIEIRMTPSDPNVPRSILYRIREDLIITIQLFEEEVRRRTIYFAWVKGGSVIPARALHKKKRIISQIFFGNMFLLLMLFLVLSYMVFLVFQFYTPIILVSSQLVIILLADKIMARIGDWSITPENPEVYILQYHVPRERFVMFQRTYTRDMLLQMKRDIYDRTLAVGRPISYEDVREVFESYGIHCEPEELSVKSINLHELVKEAARRFNLPVPKVALSNVIIPNAAATGPSPRRGLIIITTGLLIQLEEEEIFSVICHEFSHLKGRDPLALFTLVSTEYLLRVYVLWPHIFYFGLMYLISVMAFLYFIAKFFEARADLEAAMKVGRTDTLAIALRKIGFRKLQFERTPSNLISSWLGMDPHPPISFRIARLESISNLSEVKHPFLRSMVDCVHGLLAALRI